MTDSTDTPRPHPLQRLIDAGLILILVTAPTQHSLEVTPKFYVSIVDPLIWLICACWGVELLRTRSLSQIRLPPIYFLLLIGMACLSMIRSVRILNSLKDIFQLVEYFIAAYLLFYHSMRDAARLRRLLNVFLVVASLILAVGLVQYMAEPIDNFKVRATFGNRNVFGGFLALVLPLFFGLLMHETNKWKRAWYATALVAGLGVTLSGGAFVAIALSIGALALMRHPGAYVGWCVLLVALLIGVFPSLPRANYDALFESVAVYPDGYEIGERYTEWQAAAIMIEENALLGVGVGNYQENIGQYYGTLPNPIAKVEADSQNMYLVIAATMGLPGLAIFIAILISHAWCALGIHWSCTDKQTRGLSMGLFGSVLAFAISCIWSPLLVRGMGVPLVFVFALLGALAGQRKKIVT